MIGSIMGFISFILMMETDGKTYAPGTLPGKAKPSSSNIYAQARLWALRVSWDTSPSHIFLPDFETSDLATVPELRSRGDYEEMVWLYSTMLSTPKDWVRDGLEGGLWWAGLGSLDGFQFDL